MNITNKIEIKYNLKIYISLFILLLFLRSYHSFFGLSVGEHDWTFLLVGQSLYNGNLPFIEIWNMSGPFVFIFYAIPFYFTNYLIALKFLGIISIWIACVASYHTSKKIFGRKAGLFASFGLALIASSEESFLTSEVEIFIIPFLSCFIFFLFSNFSNPKISNLIFAAICISLATLMRPSLGLIAFFSIFIILFSKKEKISKIIVYILSGLTPLLITIILYSKVPDGLEILWRSTVEAHLAYPAGRPFLLGFFQFADNFSIKQWYPIFIFATLMTFVNKKYLKELIVLAIFLFLIVFSFCLTRKFSDYYVLLTFPLLTIMASSFLDEELNYSKTLLFIFTAFCYFAPFLNNITEQIKLNYRPLNNTLILYKALDKTIKKENSLFSLDNGLYLLFNKPVPSKIAHPSNMFKHYSLGAYYGKKGFSVEDELSPILQNKPDYIVMLSKWTSRLPNKIKQQINDEYKIYTFVSSDELKRMKRSNREYIESVTLYKRN